MTTSSHTRNAPRQISKNRHLGRSRLPPGPRGRSCAAGAPFPGSRSRATIASATMTSETLSTATTANSGAGPPVDCPRGAGRSPGRYPRSATPASSSSPIRAAKRPVAFSLPGIGTPLTGRSPPSRILSLSWHVVGVRAHGYRGWMTRTRDDDACPGALQLHQAADGALARVRLPGGVITAGQLEALAQTAARFGCGAMELTSRGNLQIRGITDAAAVADGVAAAGLLPSPTHERVRNIVASPLSGRVGVHADVRAWIGALDAAIRAEPALAGLPGRFWFAIDDGRGDVSGLGADVGVHVLGDSAALLLAGRDSGVRLSPPDVVRALVAVAARFTRVRGKAWRVAEFSDTRTLLDGLDAAALPGATWPAVTRPPVGWIPQNDGRVALGAAVPLGVLRARTAEYLAAIGAPAVITPWRSVLVFDADVRADAAAAVSSTPDGPHRHYVGCERACGSPPTGEVLVATGDGYRRLRR